LVLGWVRDVVKKTGYKNWERKLKVTGGAVNVSAELEKLP
jgi:hypothetical protein